MADRDVRLTRRLLRLVIAVLIVNVVFGGALSIGAMVIAVRVQSNTDDIETVARLDTAAAREARYRNCEREQRLRAEQQFRASLTPPGSIQQLVRQLGLPAALAKQTTVEAVRQRLPIFNCDPLLFEGRGVTSQANSLTAREQADYVRRYAAGLIDPTP